MNPKINIRAEDKGDIQEVHQVIKPAFETISYSNQKEHLLVDALREAGAIEVSLVAELNDDVVGHIAFSKVSINGKECDWFGLAPVSVHPDFQNQEIGSKLIREGLDRIKLSEAKGCVLLGEPEYYNRFGFRKSDQLTLEGVPAEYFLILSFKDSIPEGTVEYHPLFSEYG